MKYAVEMVSVAIIYSYVPNFIKIGSGVQKLMGWGGSQTHKHTDAQTHGHNGDRISLLSFFFKIRKVGYKRKRLCDVMNSIW
jgi:hypothetical protein